MSELISSRVSNWTFAPELWRNGRIQLRPGRIVAVIVICAALSLSAVAYFFYSPGASAAEKAALDLMRTMVIVQIAVLLIGGGIYCLQSVHREKELNTFDYQRITRLRPIELAIGKLFGAPALTYMIVLCLMPVTLVAAFVAQISMWTLLQIYLILVLGSVTFHALALLISLVAPRGVSAGAILFFLFLVSSGSMVGVSNTFATRQMTPFFAIELLSPPSPSLQNGLAPLPPGGDLFLGEPVSHVVVLTVIYATFFAFFLLALARNIKRDPSAYEIYAPWQGLAFVLYLNALVLGFFRWMTPQFVPRPPGAAGPFVPRMELRPISASAAEVTFLQIGLWLFAILGLALLRNREQVRRRVRQLGAAASGWWAAIWPSPYLLAGALVIGAVILATIRYKVEDYGNWNMQVGMLEVAFFALWLARDFEYLQWMNLRKGRRPLVAGVLYLIIFYVCVSTCMVAFDLYQPGTAAYRAIFVPVAAFGLDDFTWTEAQGLWLGALLLLVLQTLGFVWLQRRELGKLARPSGETPAMPA